MIRTFVLKKGNSKVPVLTLFRMGFFGTAHGWGGLFGLFDPPSLKCVTRILQ